MAKAWRVRAGRNGRLYDVFKEREVVVHLRRLRGD